MDGCGVAAGHGLWGISRVFYTWWRQGRHSKNLLTVFWEYMIVATDIEYFQQIFSHREVVIQ
jgi:hypothetical protein